MSSHLTELIKAIERRNEQEIITNLSLLLQAQNADIELDSNFIPKQIVYMNNEKITKPFLELAAELCKTEKNRSQFTDKEIITFLLQQLEKQDETTQISAIRALGNICYENDDASRLFDSISLGKIIKLLFADANSKNSLLTVNVAGFLLNLLIMNEDLQKEALKLNIIDAIQIILNKYKIRFNDNQRLITFILQILAECVDFVDELNVAFSESLCSLLVDILRLSSTPEISAICLNILHDQAEKEEIKVVLAKRGACELIFELIEKHRNEVHDEDSRAVMKNACDIIVSILTGEECMASLYDEGKGVVYKNMISWLSTDDADLLSTGVLALGNFARKDLHCIQMVNNGVSSQLIKLVSKYNTSQGDIKVQHALLSTIKNLAIPPENKPKIVEQGLIEALYPMIELDRYLVIFKLLGTIRMIIDGQERVALDLISRKEFIEKLMHWCYNSDHLGIRGEIPRLLAWLIKHCHSFQPFEQLVQVRGCVKCLVEMIASNHAVMQNESFFAINLLAIGCGHSNDGNANGVSDGNSVAQENFFKQLIEAELGKNLTFVINKYSEKMDKHTVENLLTVFEQLIGSSLICQHFAESEMDEAFNNLVKNINCTGNLKDRLDIIRKTIY